MRLGQSGGGREKGVTAAICCCLPTAPSPPTHTLQESEGEEAEQSRVELPAEAGAKAGARQSRVRLYEVRSLGALRLTAALGVVLECASAMIEHAWLSMRG